MITFIDNYDKIVQELDILVYFLILDQKGGARWLGKVKFSHTQDS
jgi:hypothetical protein